LAERNTMSSQNLMETVAMLFNRQNAIQLLSLVFLAAGAAVARADAIETLQGVWVAEDTTCKAVFEKVGGKVRFKSRTFAPESGFIISGKISRGPLGECKISKVEEENNHFSALLTCSDALLTKKMSMTFRIIDATHFERVDVSKHFTIKHKKCEF
jgi:hypothetical protein